jgi:photosystem II stability/assembly factor-like uncharacterized protein
LTAKVALALLLLAGAAGSGERWEPSHGPEGGPALAIAVSPSAPETVYVGTGRGVFRSVNGGGSWVSAGLARPQRVVSLAVDPRSPDTVYAGLEGRQPVFESSNGGRSWRALDLRGQPVAIAPTEPATVYAAAGWYGGPDRLFRSTNGGRSWQRADRGLPAIYRLTLAFDPTAPATVYATTGAPTGAPGLFVSSDGGGSWRRLGVPAADGRVTAVAVDPQHPLTLYAGADAGVIESLDGGGSWRLVNAAMGGHDRDRDYGLVSALLVDPRDSQTLYATTGCTGFFKSSDGGRRWSPINGGLEPGCSASHSLALDPRSPQTVYATDSRGVFRSLDTGAHWQAANTGLSLSTVFSLAVDPQRQETVYAAAGDLGLFESDDGGAQWRSLAAGPKLVEQIAVDPSNPRNLLALATGYSVERSSDAGRTWIAAALGGYAGSTRVVAIRGKAAYAGGRHLLGSSDGGRRWHELGALDALGAFIVQALAIAPGDPGVVYADLAGVGASTAGGLYKSTDAGNNWTRLTDANGAMTLNPTSPATIYVASGGGVVKTTDGGTDWEPAGSGLPRYVTALAIDPVHPTTVYAAVQRHGVFRSTDSGRSWQPLNAGLTVLDVRTLALDATGQTLYAGTSGGGVVILHVTE